jgi:ligand-binding sensor domain-containing protein
MSEATRPAGRSALLANIAIGVWAVGFIAMLVWVSRGTAPAPPPAGWQHWRGLGGVRALATVPGGAYVGGTKGVFRIASGDGSEAVTVDGLPPAAVVHALALDDEGRLWVGYDQGLAVRDADTWHHLRGDALPGRLVYSLTSTPLGVWAGTDDGAALLQWDAGAIRVRRTLTSGNGLLPGTVTAVVAPDADTVWIATSGTPGSGVSRLQHGAWEYWTIAQGLPHSHVTSLLLDDSGRIWVGCGLIDRGGAAVIADTTNGWQVERTLGANELAGAKVRSLYQDGQGRIWLGSEYDGVAVRGGGHMLRRLDTRDGLAGQEVIAMRQTPDQGMLIASLQGVARASAEALGRLLPAAPSTRP